VSALENRDERCNYRKGTWSAGFSLLNPKAEWSRVLPGGYEIGAVTHRLLDAGLGKMQLLSLFM